MMKQKTFLKTVSFVLLAIFLTSNTRSQNKVSLLGVDHVGINVPDLQQAVHFFTDVLDFHVITQIGPVPLDSNWKKANHMHQATGPVTIKMSRAGDGANIELFYYDKGKGSTIQPGGDDIGATHIAFYTSDIKASIAYLKSKGVTFLGEPFTMPAGDTEGETWVYFLTPWGAKMELVTYPDGKGYEKNNPGIKLWSPKEVSVAPSVADTLSGQQLAELATRHLENWNNTDAASRLKGLTALYTTNVIFADASYVSTGLDGLNTFIGHLQQEHPGFRFSLDRIDANHHLVRLFWNYGDKNHPALVTGMDMITVEQGKIKSLYAFLNTEHK